MYNPFSGAGKGIPEMSDQPKPASGEWTAGTLRQIFNDNEWIDDFFAKIADAHNAALAAGRERIKVLESGTALNAVIETNQQLREQLAAEREKVQTLRDALTKVRHGFGDWDATADYIDNALAKIGGKGA